MEDTLRGKNKYLEGFTMYCLNPCSNGRHSQSKKVRLEDPKAVLILVLMEDTLRATDNCAKNTYP